MRNSVMRYAQMSKGVGGSYDEEVDGKVPGIEKAQAAEANGVDEEFPE